MNRNVVVIEDDRDILDLIEYILVDEGYNVIGYNRLERPEKILEQQPSVILLDNRLANGYGNTLCLSLKTSEETKHIPVIMVSASGGLEQIANTCKADAFLAKPFDLEDLVSMVKHYSDLQYS
jgi:two-component system, OmpR family, phosphate regulon response regulator PhoB